MCHNTFLHVHIILVGKCHAFGLSDSSPFPLGKGRVFIFTTMRRCNLKLERSLPGQQSTQSDIPSLGYPRANSTVLACAAQPQETGLKIQSIAPFKGSAGNSWNQTVERKWCVFEGWLMVKATHSSLMNSQVMKKRRIWRGRRQRHGWIVVGLRMSIFETHTGCFSVILGLENPQLLLLPLLDRIEMNSREMWDIYTLWIRGKTKWVCCRIIQH